ncbi:glycosyl hydrolase [Streptomyces flaveolus]|uniref:glycosyl hydrolase n=1 Tax=Streptomyces flaveolus TaxID=67297 RepID=UPI003823D4A8
MLDATAASTAASTETPALTESTFADPPTSVKPMYRWWMPLAHTDDDELRAEVRDMYEHGAGGFEISPFVIAGPGNQDNASLATYGWGTPRWAHKMEVITGEAAKYGMKVDQNLGFQYPPTVPTLNSFNQPEAEQQVIYGREFNDPGTTRSGPLPAPTVAPPQVSLQLCRPAHAGDKTLHVSSVRLATGQAPTGQQTGVGGVAVGDQVTVGSGAAAEVVTVTALGSRLDACGTASVSALAGPHALGDSVTDTARTTRIRTVVAQCADACTASTPAPVGLDPASVVDVTAKVVDGRLDYRFPAGNGHPWVVIDFLQSPSGFLAQRGGQSYTQPDYVVDHLSAGGARIQGDYWDENVLTDPVLRNLKRTGRDNAVFEDSLELGTSQKWTWNFLEKFKSLRGYDLTAMLPAIAGTGTNGTNTPAFELTGVGAKAREDYRKTLSDLYVNGYVATMQRWAKGHGLEFRAQMYGQPISMAQAASVAGVPETELHEGEAAQDHRTINAGVRYAGRNLMSAECCFVFLGNYRSSLAGPTVGGNLGAPVPNPLPVGGAQSQGLLDSVYQTYAGGVNQLIWHGYPYRDAPQDTTADNAIGRDGGTWPGYEPWDLRGNGPNTSEAFGVRQPSWSDYTAVNEQLARTQLVLRQGVSSVDLGVYYEDLGQRTSGTHQFSKVSATPAAGYTNDYVAPEFLDNLPAYRALVLLNQSTITVDGAKDLLKVARGGMPVFIVGPAPATTTGNDATAAQLHTIVTDLLAQPSVHQVADESQLPTALREAGIRPAVAPSTPTHGINYVRRVTDGISYDFVHNSTGQDVDLKLSLSGRGTPYLMDTWSGRIRPIGQYTTDGSGVTVSVRIAAYDKVITALAEPGHEPVAPGPRHVIASSSGEVITNGTKLNLRATRDGDYTTSLSDGRRDTVSVRGLTAPTGLDTWSLQAEVWSPGAKEYDTVKTTLDPVTVKARSDGTLPSWLDITDPDLTRESGIGTYTTTFDLPSSWKRGQDGAYLDLGDVLNSARVTINGHNVVVDQSDRGWIDLGKHPTPGKNTLVVRVATTLINAKRSKSGDKNYQSSAYQSTGLMGPIVLTPYRDTALR